MTGSRRLEDYYAYVDDPQARQHPHYTSAMLLVLGLLLGVVVGYSTYQIYWKIRNKERLDDCAITDLTDASTEMSQIPPQDALPAWTNTTNTAPSPRSQNYNNYVNMGETV